jgi:hypothetical protein
LGQSHVDARTAKHAEIKRRYVRGRKASARTVAGVRVNELTRLFRARHGYQLPNTEQGRDHAAIMCQHLAQTAGDPAKRVNDWLLLWCPWITLGEAGTITEQCLLKPKRWKAKTLGFRLRLIDADRTQLGIRTIAAIDLTPEQQAERRRKKAKVRNARYRRRKGAKPRAQYLASVAKPEQPWIAQGISRRTWYRRRKMALAQGS